jgi:hypothetical protein
MRTITANGAIPRNDLGEIGSWFSVVGATLHRFGSALVARSHAAKQDTAPAQTDFIPADVAAIVSSIMRIG